MVRPGGSDDHREQCAADRQSRMRPQVNHGRHAAGGCPAPGPSSSRPGWASWSATTGPSRSASSRRRRILVRHPPPGTTDVLRLVVAGRPAGRGRPPGGADPHRVPLDSWDGVVGWTAGRRLPGPDPTRGRTPQLRAAGLALPVLLATRPGRRLEPTRSPSWSAPGRVASSLADPAGRGRHRTCPPRPGPRVAAGRRHPRPVRRRPTSSTPTAVLAFDPGRRRGGAPRGSRPPPARRRRPTASTLAAVIRRARPDVAVHRPAGLRPSGPGHPGRPTDRRRRTSSAGWSPRDSRTWRSAPASCGAWSGRWCCRAGRPACTATTCTDGTPTRGWPRVLLELAAQRGAAAGGAWPRRSPPWPPTRRCSSSAAVGPPRVDGTLESAAGEWRVRRRSWRAHPACFCHLR